MAQEALHTGSVFGRYVLVEQIGAGAMGEVWVAIDPDLDRKVALKLLRRTRSGRDDNPRLLREARAMARLNHPNVATVHDVGEVEGRVFIAMEFVAGESLAEFIARGPHPWSRVVPLLLQAGAGLAAAHVAGIVHRDFKPANVLIGHDGRVRVVDFGLSASERRERPAELEDATITLPPDRKDAAVGTPAYMAPEQHRGESFDARSDQFAFGVTAFESIYGRRPFPGDHRYAVALAIVEGRITEIPSEERAPAWIHDTLLRALAGKPEARFADMPALLAVLARDDARRRRRWLAAGCGAALLAGLVAAWIAWPRAPDPCGRAGEAMSETWSDATRDELRAWLVVDAREPWRARTSERLLEGLDQHALAWTASERSLCSDRVARRTTDRLAAARSACLERQREMVAWLAELPRHDDELRELVLRHPYALLRALGQPERCLDAMPSDDEHDEQDERARTRALARAQLWLAVDRPRRAAEALVAQPCTGDCALPLALAHGKIAARLERHDEARRILPHVAARALQSEPDTSVHAWLELARVEPNHAAALDWLAYANALADARVDRTSQIEVALLGAALELDEGRVDPAMRRLTAAFALADQDPPLDPDLRAALLHLRARASRALGQLDAATRDELEAREQLELALGEAHPLTRPQ
jgi:hypothetical protein